MHQTDGPDYIEAVDEDADLWCGALELAYSDGRAWISDIFPHLPDRIGPTVDLIFGHRGEPSPGR